MNCQALVTLVGAVLWGTILVDSAPGQTEKGKDARGPRMTDAEFLAALDLTLPALAAVRRAVDRGDPAAAKRAFVQHLKARTQPKWHFDWRAKPAPNKRPAKPNVAQADRYARNELVSVGVWHDFGSDIDWSANPMPNQYREWTWQLSRHSFWPKLGQAYWDTGDEKYARTFVFQMNDWVKDNPVPLDRAANHTGSRWRTIEAGIRMGHTWFKAFAYFLSSPSFGHEDVVTMVKSFVEHAEYLMKFRTHGNWLTMEANGLYHVGAMFPEFKRAQTWRDTAIERLYKDLDIQVYPDGAQYELSTGYHQVALLNFLGPLQIGRLNGYAIPPDYLAKLERMYHYNLYAAMPDGCLPGLNDAGRHDVRGRLKEGFGYFPKRADFQWLATRGKQGTRPAHDSYAFRHAGHLVMRSGWALDDRYMLFDVGPFGAGHQHEDKLSFVIYAYGAYLVVDPGIYPYDSSQWRQYVLGSYAHNVIHVDGKYQHRRGTSKQGTYIVTKPLPHVWQTTKAFDYAAGSYGKLPGETFGKKREKVVTHTRHVLFVKTGAKTSGDAVPGDYWLVVDVLEPSNDKPHGYEAMFHLDVKDVCVDEQTQRVVSRQDDAANIAIVPAGGAGLSVEVVRGQEKPFVQGWMPAGGYRVRPIPTPVFKRTSAGVAHFVYVFYPLQKGASVPVKAVEPTALSRDSAAVRVTFRDGGEDVLHVGPAVGVERHAK